MKEEEQNEIAFSIIADAGVDSRTHTAQIRKSTNAKALIESGSVLEYNHLLNFFLYISKSLDLPVTPTIIHAE